MQTSQMEAIAASTTIKGKQPAYMPVDMSRGPSRHFSGSSASPSDNDEDAYFSDVSTSSVTSSTSSSLGDFVFDNEEEYADYFAIVKSSIKGKAAATSSNSRTAPSYSFASSSSPQSASLPHSSNKKNKTKSTYRKSTSAFFLSGSSFSSGMPQISSSLAAQNPALNQAAQALSSRISKLNSYFPREQTVRDSESEDENPAWEDRRSYNVDERFERAMMFAQWSRRGRAGAWEAPDNVNRGLAKLVELAQEN